MSVLYNCVPRSGRTCTSGGLACTKTHVRYTTMLDTQTAHCHTSPIRLPPVHNYQMRLAILANLNLHDLSKHSKLSWKPHPPNNIQLLCDPPASPADPPPAADPPPPAPHCDSYDTAQSGSPASAGRPLAAQQPCARPTLRPLRLTPGAGTRDPRNPAHPGCLQACSAEWCARPPWQHCRGNGNMPAMR